MKDLTKLYEEEDFKRSILPYTLYRKSLEEILDFNQIESFGDFGCINGRLMESIKRKYSHMEVEGFDIFEWAKQNSDPLVQDKVVITDLRQPMKLNQKYDLVNCTEVGEHIDREYEQVFLDNITTAAKQWLILSWSDEINPQHFNPRAASYIRKQVEKRGFVMLKKQTKILRNALKRNINEIGHQWWSESVYVYQRKDGLTYSKYNILGTVNRHPSTLRIYRSRFLTWSSFQEKFLNLTNSLRQATGRKKFFSLFRFGDGDFFFLMRWAKGSAAVGRRGSTIPYSQVNSPWFRYWVLKNDIIATEMEPSYRKKYLVYSLLQFPLFNSYFLKNLIRKNGEIFKQFKNYLQIIKGSLFGPKLSFEPVYALVATRWIFREYANEIGIIGNEEKVKLIQQLMQNSDYRQYLGVSKFTDYIEVPQKGAADDPIRLAETIGNQIKNSSAKVFLVGMGHAKTGVLAYLKGYSDAVFIDVGVGIDALAGCVNQERPYFAGWTNFRFKDYDYSKVDQMDYNDKGWDKTKYKTFWI